MPTICTFHGIVIKMYFEDHPLPHVHAEYGDLEALITFSPIIQLERGSLPRRQLQLVLEWATRHQAELIEDWRLAQIPSGINKIQYP